MESGWGGGGGGVGNQCALVYIEMYVDLRYSYTTKYFVLCLMKYVKYITVT